MKLKLGDLLYKDSSVAFQISQIKKSEKSTTYGVDKMYLYTGKPQVGKDFPPADFLFDIPAGQTIYLSHNEVLKYFDGLSRTRTYYTTIVGPSLSVDMTQLQQAARREFFIEKSNLINRVIGEIKSEI